MQNPDKFRVKCIKLNHTKYAKPFFPFVLQTDDLTITDRAFLNLLLTTMRHVEQDETLYPGAQSNGFLQDFHDIVELLETLTAQIDGWVSFEIFLVFDKVFVS